MPNLIGHSLGRYHILDQIGEGGMAIVYKAYDTRLETDVAVKVIRTEALPQNAIEQALKRFEREAKALAKLTHPNIVKVTDYGEYEGKPYLVMPYLPGGTLKQMLTINSRPMPWQEAAHLLIPITRALDYAHRQGMIHRDVKPSNILITDDGEPLLTDFGIAKIIDDEITMELTGTGTAIGTPEYMAPEQVTAKTVDHRADIYALGVVFYEMVTGRRPFQADTPMAVLFKHASEPLPRPKQFVPNLPDAVERVLLKALAKKPDERYANMQAFEEALEGISRGALQAQEKSVQPAGTKFGEVGQQNERSTAKVPAVVAGKTFTQKWLVVTGIAALLCIMGLGLIFLGQQGFQFLAGLPAPTLVRSPAFTQTPFNTSTESPSPVPSHTPFYSPTPTATPLKTSRPTYTAQPSQTNRPTLTVSPSQTTQPTKVPFIVVQNCTYAPFGGWDGERRSCSCSKDYCICNDYENRYYKVADFFAKYSAEGYKLKCAKVK